MRQLHDAIKLTSYEILRNDFLLKQKEWERDQALAAPEASQVIDDDEREADAPSMKGKSASRIQVYSR